MLPTHSNRCRLRISQSWCARWAHTQYMPWEYTHLAVQHDLWCSVPPGHDVLCQPLLPLLRDTSARQQWPQRAAHSTTREGRRRDSDTQGKLHPAAFSLNSGHSANSLPSRFHNDGHSMRPRTAPSTAPQRVQGVLGKKTPTERGAMWEGGAVGGVRVHCTAPTWPAQSHRS